MKAQAREDKMAKQTEKARLEIERQKRDDAENKRKELEEMLKKYQEESERNRKGEHGLWWYCIMVSSLFNNKWNGLSLCCILNIEHKTEYIVSIFQS